MRYNQYQKMILKEMIKIFYPSHSEYIDWMGFPITEENYPTYHHIEKKCELKKKKDDGIATIENGAILGKRSHEILHEIELLDADLFASWNYLFSVINKMRIYPIDDVWNMVFQLKDKTQEVLDLKNCVKKTL